MGKQCRERWIGQLAPCVSKENWSADEDAVLIREHLAVGNKWTAIAAQLPGRSALQVKNRRNWLTRRNERADWPVADSFAPPDILTLVLMMRRLTPRNRKTATGSPCFLKPEFAREGMSVLVKPKMLRRLSPGVVLSLSFCCSIHLNLDRLALQEPNSDRTSRRSDRTTLQVRFTHLPAPFCLSSRPVPSSSSSWFVTLVAEIRNICGKRRFRAIAVQVDAPDYLIYDRNFRFVIHSSQRSRAHRYIFDPHL
jgi:hypothetical protein